MANIKNRCTTNLKTGMFVGTNFSGLGLAGINFICVHVHALVASAILQIYYILAGTMLVIFTQFANFAEIIPYLHKSRLKVISTCNFQAMNLLVTPS